MKKKEPKCYPIIKQVYSLRKFCTVTRPPNPLRFDPVTSLLATLEGLERIMVTAFWLLMHNYSSVIYLSRNAF